MVASVGDCSQVGQAMRIMVWSTFLTPHVGGYEKNVLELSRRLVTRGHEVTVVTCNTHHASEIEMIDGVKVYRLPCVVLLGGLYPLPIPSRLLFNVMANKHCDVVITQTRFFFLSLAGTVFALVHRAPLVHVERGSSHVLSTNPILRLVSRVYDHSIGRWLMSRAQAVIGVSDAARDFASHLGTQAITIPNGVCCAPANNTPKLPMVLYVGRLAHAKGVQDLIQAFKGIDSKYFLAIVGDGAYTANLRALAHGHSNIVFCGELTGEGLDHLYRSACLFVNPSYSEGLPTAVMEAMAAGVPVIATDVGGTREIVESGVTGLLLPPKYIAFLRHSIGWMLANDIKARVMARRGRERVLDRYSWDKITDQYCKLLETLRAA